jgi:hypothetical protein
MNFLTKNLNCSKPAYWLLVPKENYSAAHFTNSFYLIGINRVFIFYIRKFPWLQILWVIRGRPYNTQRDFLRFLSPPPPSQRKTLQIPIFLKSFVTNRWTLPPRALHIIWTTPNSIFSIDIKWPSESQ